MAFILLVYKGRHYHEYSDSFPRIYSHINHLVKTVMVGTVPGCTLQSPGLRISHPYFIFNPAAYEEGAIVVPIILSIDKDAEM